ncbi:MAG: FAD-binding oxidoreductase [Candidatus Thorarchaeota archaeon]|jgi:FAD/FMN-containing dehydrogenase
MVRSGHYPLYRELSQIVGREMVADEDYALAANRRDGGIEKGVLPGIIVRPQNTSQVAMIMRLANRANTHVTIRGGASQAGGGGTPLYPGGILLDMTDMNQIVQIDEGAMTATVQGGATYGPLIEELHKRGLTCCLGPHAIYTATVGGCVASNSVCIGSAMYGLYGTQVVSLEVVLPTGEIIRTGSDATKNGGRFHRYVNGPDMTGMFVGGCGIFGVITEATLWIYPEFETRDFATFCFNSLESGSKALLEHTNLGLYDGYENFGKHTIKTLRVRGGYYDEMPEDTLFLSRMCVAGDEDHVEKKMEKIEAITTKYEGVAISPELAKEPTYDIGGDCFSKLRAYGVAAPVVPVIPILKLPYVHRIVEEYMDKNEHLCNPIKEAPELRSWSTSGILSEGGTMVFSSRFTFSEATMEQGWTAWHKLIELIIRLGACPYWTGKAWTSALVRNYRPHYYQFLSSLKKHMDPNNILNPGLLMEEIDSFGE